MLIKSLLMSDFTRVLLEFIRLNRTSGKLYYFCQVNIDSAAVYCAGCCYSPSNVKNWVLATANKEPVLFHMQTALRSATLPSRCTMSPFSGQSGFLWSRMTFIKTVTPLLLPAYTANMPHSHSQMHEKC